MGKIDRRLALLLFTSLPKIETMSVTLAAIGGAAALGSAIYGAVKSSQMNEKARALIQKQRDDNRAWYNTRMSQDYTMRSDVQAALKRQREMLDERYKRAQATKVVAGGTEEGLAQQRQDANRALSETMTDIASQASAYKDSVEERYRQQDAALNQQQAQGYAQQAQATAQAASQGVNAGLNLMGQGIISKEQVAGAVAGAATGGASGVAGAVIPRGQNLSVPVNSDFSPKTIAPAPSLPDPSLRGQDTSGIYRGIVKKEV